MLQANPSAGGVLELNLSATAVGGTEIIERLESVGETFRAVRLPQPTVVVQLSVIVQHAEGAA
jgi:hypothetical protein